MKLPISTGDGVVCEQIDRPGVDADEATDRISRELLQHDVITEAYGGQVPIVPVSSSIHIFLA